MSAYWSRNVPEEELSYLKAMLKTPTNINFAAGSLAASALLSIPLGLAGAALPLLLFATGETMAALFIPDSSKFRAWVNRNHRRKRREKARDHLIREIARTAYSEDDRWDVQRRMEQRAEALAAVYEQGNRALTEADVERTQDAAVDYLALWLVSLTMNARLAALNPEELGRRKRAVQKRQEQSASDRNLNQAAADLTSLEQRRLDLEARLTAVDTTMLTLPDAVEEAYQAALAPVEAGATGQRLREAVQRLEVERNIEVAFEEDAELALDATPRAAQRSRLRQQT